jgi:hypothetical protein
MLTLLSSLLLLLEADDANEATEQQWEELMAVATAQHLLPLIPINAIPPRRDTTERIMTVCIVRISFLYDTQLNTSSFLRMYTD